MKTDALAAGRPLADRPSLLEALFPGRDFYTRAGFGLVILILWEVGVRAGAPAYVAKPLNILAVLPTVLSSPEFHASAWATVGAVIEGLAISLVAGTVVGVAMGRVKVVDRLLSFYINSFFAMPMIAILPLLTLWFGYSEQTRLALVVFASFFSITMNAADGARSVPPEYIEVARAYGARARHIWFGTTLPASLPYLLAGVRLAAGRALVGAVIAEFMVSIDGLGFYILYNTRTFHHNEAFVGVLVLSVFGVGVDVGLNRLLHRFMPWFRRPEEN